MMIAEEGFKDTKIFTLLKKGWETIKNAVNKLVAKISSFLIKICSKGDKVLVNNEFYNVYINLENDIDSRFHMDSTDKREMDAKINELLQKPHKSTDGGGNTISISEISNKLKVLNMGLGKLNRSADKALIRLKNARKDFNDAKTKDDEYHENLYHSNLDDLQDDIRTAHDSALKTLGKEFDFNDAKKRLEQANGLLYRTELLIKLYTGMLNKIN